MKFNANNYVKVKVTELGKKILQNTDLRFFEINKEDENGWTKFQLWELMAIFGSHFSLGMDVPFEMEIDILE